MYRDKKFRARSVTEIIEDLDMALAAYGPGVRTIFLADGNSAVLSTDRLVAIGEAARELFPGLERITVYGSAKFLAKKSREGGRPSHGRVSPVSHSGLESGDPKHLPPFKRRHPGGCGGRIYPCHRCGPQVSVYLMVGVADGSGWREHAWAHRC